MPKAPEDQWFICTESFVSADPELHFHGRQGVSRVRASDPVYRRWPQFFAPLKSSDPGASEAVEEAVAPPGRKRGE